MNLREKIESRAIPEPNSGCLLWTGRVSKAGYGYAWDGEREREVHRIYYEMEKGAIPPGLVLDHLCRVRCCINPAHLEPVTMLTNCHARSLYEPRSHCAKGHEMTPENTRVWIYSKKGQVWHICKKCHAAQKREQYRRKRRK